jgi:hypothetical protein
MAGATACPMLSVEPVSGFLRMIWPTYPTLVAGAVLALSTASLLNAQASTSGSLDLSSFSATPAAGSISWSGTWTLNAVSSSNNSVGGLDFGFDFGESANASASSAVTWADGNVSGSASGPSSVAGHVDGSVNLPATSGLEAAVGSFGNNVTLETQFSLDGAAGANVTFAAEIRSLLEGITGPDGQVLHDETILNFNVDGSTVLFFDDLRTLGPDQALVDLQTPSLSDTVNLAGGPHDLFIELDTEQQAITVPETPCPLVLAEAAGFLLALRRPWRRREES